MDMSHDACYRAIATRDPRFDGRLFTGVITTGVYCRPICPARTPKPENVRFFPSAAAAQGAGFRPCLRCRPETSPDLGAWRGASNTVSRGLALIEAGALDAGDVDALAGRLGVGERQLRRLFRQHLGASPIAVAQTRRVLLAKQLIHQTRLPMTEVALAAGFGSVRRFNETFQSLYGRPPASLRRAQPATGEDPSVIHLSLPYRPPYDWDALLAFLGARAIAGVERVTARGYARTIGRGGEAGTLHVRRLAGRNALAVDLHFPRLAALPALLARVRRVFDLAADPEAIAAHLATDPDLAPLVGARPGLRVPGAWDGFELATRGILGQQITVAAAASLAETLVRGWGEPLPPDPERIAGLTHLFPTPERLAEADLSGLPMPRARSAALVALARAVRADPGFFGPGRSLEDAIARLRAVPGIGEWTAHYIAMRELREPDAFPAADVGLQRALAGPDGRRPDTAALARRAHAWRPWRAYAALHLWTALDPSLPPAFQKEPSHGRKAA